MKKSVGRLLYPNTAWYFALMQTGPWLVIRMRLFSCGFFHLFRVDGGLPGRSAQSNPYLFFKKRVKSFGRKIKNHPARRPE